MAPQTQNTMKSANELAGEASFAEWKADADHINMVSRNRVKSADELAVQAMLDEWNEETKQTMTASRNRVKSTAELAVAAELAAWQNDINEMATASRKRVKSADELAVEAEIREMSREANQEFKAFSRGITTSMGVLHRRLPKSSSNVTADGNSNATTAAELQPCITGTMNSATATQPSPDKKVDHGPGVGIKRAMKEFVTETVLKRPRRM
ncbi:hypothetical protein F5Y18DRAFT_424691 [Xylariaceae sp. FL1019]|nr:hypothetical protein F5Y18DRAFT_424691 [Xylariaceae sp. FL1019]